MSGQEVLAVLNVLIVDDEAPARERLRDLLGDVAATQPTRIVGMAANGHEALRFLTAQQVDLLLVDIRMPGMDGIELAQHVARLASPPRIVFVTAYDQYAVSAFDLNAIDYLLKPVRAQRLEAALGRRWRKCAQACRWRVRRLIASPNRDGISR